MASNEHNLEVLEEEIRKMKLQVNAQMEKLNEMEHLMEYLRRDQTPEPSGIKTLVVNEPLTLENFIGLKLIHFVGIIVLVIGLSIGVKYAIDKDLLSQVMRISLAYAAAGILLILAFRLKKKYKLFSAILFSGAMSSFYFTTYGSYVYYQIFSASLAFSLMIILTIFTIYQAIIYDLQIIGLLGMVAAYGIPFLISKNTDRADLFFSYIFLINLGIVFLTIRKQWKWVMNIATILTWIIFIGWTNVRFDVGWETTGKIFLMLFFVLFSFAQVGSYFIYKKALTGRENYMLLFNNIALYISCLYIFGSGYYAIKNAHIAFYMFVTAGVEAFLLRFYLKENKAGTNLLVNYTIILFMLFIAIALKGMTVTLLWLLTAVILFTVGVRYKYMKTRMAAIWLMGATLLKLLVIDSQTFTTIEKIISYLLLGILLLIISFYYQKLRHQLFENEGN